MSARFRFSLRELRLLFRRPFVVLIIRSLWYELRVFADNRQLTTDNMISSPSFAKINLGLKIGPARPDRFHELRTVYQTLALHDVIRVEVVAGEGIEIRCSDPRVPLDA